MNFKMKEIGLLVVVILLSFPVVFFGVLFMTGNARVEFGPPKKEAIREKEVEIIKISPKAESLTVANAKIFKALQQERSAISKERENLAEQHKNLEVYQNDLETQKGELKKQQQAIESAVSTSEALGKKKAAQQAAQLAKIYSAMRPAEAAQIISTLSDELAARILDGIGDDRQKAKILAALPQEKATKISQFMGGSIRH
jgi:flagellar motility protein MotE (MotC chaperone)